MNKKLQHITARHKNSLRIVDLYYFTLEEAIVRNPGYEDFIIVGCKK